MEVLGSPFNCFDATEYGTLLIVDPEEEFFDEEIAKLVNDVEQGLNLAIFGDWFNTSVMDKVRFFDENTRQWWVPDTGGSNIPALNELLAKFEIEFGNGVSEGDFQLAGREMYYASGTSIRSFPQDGKVLTRVLKDQGQEILRGHNAENRDEVLDSRNVAILGLAEVSDGRISVYGDSNCLDGVHLQKDCFWLLEEILQYFRTGVTTVANGQLKKWSDVQDDIRPLVGTPERLAGNHLYRFSKVLENSLVLRKKSLPLCPALLYILPQAINKSETEQVWKHRPLLAIDLDSEPAHQMNSLPDPNSAAQMPLWVWSFVLLCCFSTVLFLFAQFRKPSKERRHTKSGTLPSTSSKKYKPRKNLNT